MTKSETINELYKLKLNAIRLPKSPDVKKLIDDIHGQIITASKVNTTARTCGLLLKDVKNNYKQVTGEEF